MPRKVKAPTRRKATALENNNEEVPSKKIKRTVFSLPLPQINSAKGKVLACGQGDMGQLGLGDDEKDMERKRPALVPNLADIVDVRAGGMHNLCLDINGMVYSFGCNDEGALGRNSSEEGSEFVPKKVDLPKKCLKISAGDSHSACLLEDGSVFAWGSFRDSHGTMGLTLDGSKSTPTQVLPEFVCCDIASGADHLVMLTCGGKVYTMGCGEQGQLGRLSLRSASGETRRGKTELLAPKLVITPQRKHIDAIWTTTYCTFLREAETSTIWAFGLNNYKQLNCPKEDSVVTRPFNTGFDNVKMIAGGQHHTLVLKNDDSVYAIGRKDYGRLGLGNVAEDVTELKLIEGLSGKNIKKISRGEAQSFAITQDGLLYAWGMASSHQLGTGEEDDALVPTLIESKQTKDKKILQADGGGQHSIFLVADDSPAPEIVKKTTKTAAAVKKPVVEKEPTAVVAAAPETATVAVPESTTEEGDTEAAKDKLTNGETQKAKKRAPAAQKTTAQATDKPKKKK